MIFFAKIQNFIAVFVGFFSGYFYGDFNDNQFDLQEESPQPVPTPPTLPPVVVSESSIPVWNSSYFGSCAVQFSFESFANRTCLAQTAELPIDVIFSTVSRYWNYFGWFILFYGMLTFGYRIFKWLKGNRTRRAISETVEPISPKPLVVEPHSSPMLGFGFQDKPGMSQIPESAIEISQQSKNRTFTIVVLGDSGVGKSTLICSLANYAKWPKFEDIRGKLDKLEVCIPVRFDINYRDGSPSKTVSVGDDESNLNENFNTAGQSVTQMPKVHEYTFGAHRLRIIDTPGLNDTRGLEQDQRHLEQIKKIIQNQPEIHAFVFTLKTSQNRLTTEFELAIRSLLSILPTNAVPNIFFFCTFSRIAFFVADDAVNVMATFFKKFNELHLLPIPIQENRFFCVDSESFRYLLAKSQGIQYSTRKEKDFSYSWEKSAESIAEFTNALKDLPPIKGKDIVFAENLVKTALNFCDWYEANGSNLPAEDKAEFDANLADLLKSVLNKTMPLEMPRIKRVLAVLNCGSILTDNSAVLERIKTLLKIQKKFTSP